MLLSSDLSLVAIGVALGRADQQSRNAFRPWPRWPLVRDDVSGFHQLFEAEKVIDNLLLRLFTEDPGQRCSGYTARWSIPHIHFHHRAAISGRFFEADFAGVVDVSVWQRAPRNQFIGSVFHHLG